MDASNDQSAHVKGVVAVSAPFDVLSTAVKLQRTAFGLIDRFLSYKLFRAFNDYCFHNQDEQVPPEAFKNAKRSMTAFDNETRAKAWGFSSSNQLYRHISCGHFLSYINVPFLVIHSRDDIVCRSEDVPRVDLLANKNCMYLETRYGGHCDFFSSSDMPKAKLYPNIVTKYLEDIIEYERAENVK